MKKSIQMQASIVIIGSGCIGCSVAYHLAQMGFDDVVVLEREDSVASVTTAQAAGNIGQVRSSVERILFEMDCVATYRKLQENLDAPPAWRETGSIRIALTDQRMAEFRDLVANAEQAGLEVELYDHAPDNMLWPGMISEKIKGILWCPSDGYLQPVDLANAYQHNAKAGGVKFHTGVEVEGIALRNGRVDMVHTNLGNIKCEKVINCGGSNAWQIARMVGLEFPIFPVRHQYMITTPIDGVTPDLPVFRIPDLNLYGRADINSLLLGGWEVSATSVDPREVSWAEGMPLAEPSMDAQSQFVENCARLFPAVMEAGVRSMFSGWPTVTPDGGYSIGETSAVPGFVMGTACNIHGIGGSAAIGKLVAESISGGAISAYGSGYVADRLLNITESWADQKSGAVKISESYYTLRASYR